MTMYQSLLMALVSLPFCHILCTRKLGPEEVSVSLIAASLQANATFHLFSQHPFLSH